MELKSRKDRSNSRSVAIELNNKHLVIECSVQLFFLWTMLWEVNYAISPDQVRQRGERSEIKKVWQISVLVLPKLLWIWFFTLTSMSPPKA